MINYIDWAMLASVYDLHPVSLLFNNSDQSLPPFLNSQFLNYSCITVKWIQNVHQQVQYYELPMHSIACYIQTSI